MAKCNIPNGLFQSVKGRKFNIDFTGGNISSDGGILPLAELDKHLHLMSSVAAVLALLTNVKRVKSNMIIFPCCGNAFTELRPETKI